MFNLSGGHIITSLPLPRCVLKQLKGGLECNLILIFFV